MRFFISCLSIASLATVVLASAVYQDDLRGSWNDRNQVGENPLELNDMDELLDETFLNRLAETRKELADQDIDMDRIEEGIDRNSGTIKYQAKRMLRMGFRCPSSVMLFNGREDVKFVLYNKYLPTTGVDISKYLEEGRLIPNAPIKFLIHGFLNGGNSWMMHEVKEAYLSLEDDYNVIAVDWTKGSGTWLSNYLNCLITSRIVPKVGEAVATFIVDLVNKQNVNILNVNVIGHSLGAQIAGRAGKKLIELGYKLPIIVGLDPALPEFKYNNETERLAPTDADYVEVIHTNPGDLGFETPLGVADFYPNWGYNRYNRQPNCITPACSHAMSFQLFAESITNPRGFKAYKCESFQYMKKGLCEYRGGNQITAFMGGADMRFGKYAGVFKLETNHYAPFAKN